jgi:hypothetical protein
VRFGDGTEVKGSILVVLMVQSPKPGTNFFQSTSCRYGREMVLWEDQSDS